MSNQPNPFVVALTADFYDASGKPKYRDLGLSVFDGHRHIQRRVIREHRPVIGADQIEGVHGVIVLTPAVDAKTVSSPTLLVIGRFGVGYDAVDVQACTAADVVAFITAGAVDHSVAEAVVGWMLALTHHTLVKDRLLRQGRWNERSAWMGCELRDRVFGAVGLGGIARKTIQLLGGFSMKPPIAFDPFVTPEAAGAMGVRLVTLDELMAEADFVSVHCPLNDKTRGLIGRAQIQKMKPTAYLLNTARGGIVDEDALFEALKNRRIAGAALDCFVGEPIVTPHRFGELDNVILAPHSIAWTDELFRDIGRAVCQGMVDLSLGRRPRGVVNPEVFERASFREKWKRTCGRDVA